VHETVSGKALDRAMEIAQRLSSYTPESVAYSKRLVRTPRDAAGAGTVTRTKFSSEIVHANTLARCVL